MSNDVRGLLRDAAIVPSTGADGAGAWSRGRRLRARRLAAVGLSIVAVVTLGSIAVANVLPSGHDTVPAGPATTIAGSCGAPSTATLPAWALTAHAPRDVPHVLSADGGVIAVLFGYPLQAGSPTQHQNKILWIVRQPRGGTPLEITATLPGTEVGPVHLAFPDNSSPGEIYPSIDNVGAAGCWHFALAWNGRRAAVNLDYVAVPPTGNTAPPPTTIATNPTTGSAAPATCRTANLTVTLGPPIGSAGHLNYEIAFRNDGPSACVMTGYPGVSFFDGSGHQIGVPAQRNPIPAALVTLAPGATAYAPLSVTDPSVLNGCPATPTQQILVFPPNETAPVFIGSRGIVVCATQPASIIDPVSDHSLG
jgi:hypothetical protein